jgi:hypothetical protein
VLASESANAVVDNRHLESALALDSKFGRHDFDYCCRSDGPVGCIVRGACREVEFLGIG